MTSTAQEVPSLRDRLAKSLSFYAEADDVRAAVEAVCQDMSGWLQAMAQDWRQIASESGDMMGYGKAAASLCEGLADGITAGAPDKVTDQDPGVQSES